MNLELTMILMERPFVTDVSFYIPHFIPNISQKNLLLGQFVSKSATELLYIEIFFNI